MLNLNRVYLSVFDCNERGVRAYEKAGFRLEGRFLQARFRNGVYHDELRDAIVKEEWDRNAISAAESGSD